jgi:hypothetical protein
MCAFAKKSKYLNDHAPRGQAVASLAASTRQSPHTTQLQRLQSKMNRSNAVKQLLATQRRIDARPTAQLQAAPIQFGRTRTYGKFIGKRGFTKGLKKKIGGVRSGYDISHKASANVIGILHKRIMKNPSRMSSKFPRRLNRITDRSAFTKKDHITFDEGIEALERLKNGKKLTEKQYKIVAHTFRLFANRNVKNLRNKKASENRRIGAYPHFNIEDGELSDDGEEISTTLNSQLEKFDDEEYSDDEDLRISKSYTELPNYVGKKGKYNGRKKLANTSDQVEYRKKKYGDF